MAGYYTTSIRLFVEGKDIEYVYEMITTLFMPILGGGEESSNGGLVPEEEEGVDILDLVFIIPVFLVLEILLFLSCWYLLRTRLDREYKVGDRLGDGTLGIVR